LSFSYLYSMRHQLIFVFAFVFALAHKSQVPNLMQLSTASNSLATGTLTYGTNDLNWTAALSSSVGPYFPAKVVGWQSGWSTSPVSYADWVVYNHTCAVNPAQHNCSGSVIDEYYKLIITLPSQVCGQAVTTASAFCMPMDFLADNCITNVWLNGVLVYNTPVATPSLHTGFNLFNKVSLPLCNYWQAGTNTLIVHNVSGAPQASGLSGFLAFPNYTLNTSIVPFNSVLTSSNANCFGGTGSATVNAVGGGGSITYSWIPSGGTTSIANSLGSGTYTVLVASANSCTAAHSVNITQPPALTLNVSAGSPTACTGSSVVLTFTATGGTPGYFNGWVSGPTSSTLFSATSMVPGNITFTALASDFKNCQASKTLSVLFLPTPTLSITGGSICSGTTGTISVTGASAYTWQPSGNNAPSFTINPVANMIFTVSGSQNNCTSTRTLSVNVLPTPTLSVSGASACSAGNGTMIASGASGYTWMPAMTSGNTFTFAAFPVNQYTLSGNTGICYTSVPVQVTIIPTPTISVSGNQVCAGNSATLSATGANNYTWQPSGATGNTFPSVPFSQTVYTVTGKNSDCISSATVQLALAANHTVTITGPVKKICKGDKVILNASGASSYLWSNSSTAQSITITAVSPITYTVTGTGSLCPATGAYALTVAACTGLNESVNDEVSIYPSPVTNKLTVRLNYFHSNCRLVIFNISGQQVFTRSDLHEGENDLRVAEFPAGIYILILHQGNETKALRFLKE
jgi:hypothetical protein